MEAYIELTAEACNPKFFRAGFVNWNEGTSINISCTTYKTEERQGKLSYIFTPTYF